MKIKEAQYVSLETEYQRVLAFIHTRDTKHSNTQENTEFSTRCYQIEYIKDIQHKNVSMSWDYRKFPCHPVTSI